MTVFLTCSSHKEWQKLDLYDCYIQDHGVHILHSGLASCDVIITSLRLWNNGLTESSSSSAISDITISCKVKKLYISGNKIVGEDERLYSIISDPSSMLEELHLNFTKLSSNAAIKLFTALSEGKKLRILSIYIINSNITDKAFYAIIMAMKNTSLVELHMLSNPISAECAQLIIQAIQSNNNLRILQLPYYSEDVRKRIALLSREVNKKRESHGCQVKLSVYLSSRFELI